MIDGKKKAFVIQLLRRGSYRWVGRWTAEKRSKIVREKVGKKTYYDYFCECCGVIVPKKETRMDHIEPVVDPEKGFIGFDDYIDRMYCGPEGFQRLCLSCNEDKTTKENEIRKEMRKKK